MPARTTAIHDLPVETLMHIFLYLVKKKGTELELRKGLPPALILRSICRRWNAVAKATPELWLELVGPYGHKWTRQALALSKDTPLDLNITEHSSYCRGFRDIALSLPHLKAESRRIRSLTIHLDEFPPKMQIDLQVALLSSPLPRLENLDFYNEDETGVIYLLDEKTLSGEIPPQLKYLEVSYYVRILPTCPILRAPLTSLVVFDSLVWESADELLQTLSCLPHLEVLNWEVTTTTFGEMGFAAPPLSKSLKHNPNPVHLPHLRSMNLCTQLETITYIFAQIAFPLSCTVEILARFDNHPQAELYLALDVAFGERLRAAFADGHDAGYKTMSIESFAHDFVAGATVLWKDATSTSGPKSFSLGFLPSWVDHEQTVHPETLSIVCHMLTQWPATSCAVSHFCNVHGGLRLSHVEPEAQPWTRILRLFPNVDSITTDYWPAVNGLVDVLAIRSPNVVLPRLRRVTLQRANLTLADFARLMSVLKTFHASEDGIGGKRMSPPTLRLERSRLNEVEIPDFVADLDLHCSRG